MSVRARRRPRQPAAHVHGLELRRCRHLTVAGSVQRARRREHRFQRDQFHHRDERILQNNVDFGATDISYATQQSIARPPKCPTRSSTCLTWPAGWPSSTTSRARTANESRISSSTGRRWLGIFTGSVKKWNDPAIEALNPGDPLPNEPIIAFYRSDPAGENYLLADYFFHVDPGPITAFQQEAQRPDHAGHAVGHLGRLPQRRPPQPGHAGRGQWCRRSLAGAPAEPGRDLIRRDRLREERRFPCGIGGQCRRSAACNRRRYNVAVALTAAILYSDLTQNLGGVYTNPNPDAYPISAYSYFVAQCVPARRPSRTSQCDSGGTSPWARRKERNWPSSSRTSRVEARPDGQSGLFAVTCQPGRRRLPSRRATARGHDAAAADAAELPEPLYHRSLQSVGGPTVLGTTNPGGSDLSGAGAAAAATGQAHAAAAAAAFRLAERPSTSTTSRRRRRDGSSCGQAEAGSRSPHQPRGRSTRARRR